MLPGARRFGAAADSAAHVHAGSSIEETNAVVVDAINDRAIEGASDIFCLVREAWPVTHPAQALLQVVTRLRVNDMVCPRASLLCTPCAHRMHTKRRVTCRTIHVATPALYCKTDEYALRRWIYNIDSRCQLWTVIGSVPTNSYAKEDIAGFFRVLCRAVMSTMGDRPVSVRAPRCWRAIGHAIVRVAVTWSSRRGRLDVDEFSRNQTTFAHVRTHSNAAARPYCMNSHN